MTKTRWKAAGILAAIIIAFSGGLWVGVDTHVLTLASAQQTTTVVAPGGTAPSGVDMSQFWQAYSLLNQDFVQTHGSTTPTTQQQIQGAISGLTASFGDPYTVFLPPSDAAIFQSDISGSFGGVGMEIDDNAQGQLVVISPLKGTPAAAAGIQSGDIILQIGTTTAANLPVDEATTLIRGPVGSTVSLLIQRGTQTPFTVTVTRATVNVPIIDTNAESDGIFVISLYSFSQNSADLFRDALRQFLQSGDHKLLLDLRGNPGGYLESAVDIGSYFLPVGDTIVTEDYEGKQANIVHSSYGYNIFADDPNFKMAILVNQDSASAAEILSGALQQHGVAKLVGTRTFGKGSVQELMDLGGGAELKVTVARWLTPNGTSISNGGLTPDIEATTTAADMAAGLDPQKTAAENYLLGQ
jgi:carboxyl-terminal processing protease